MEEPRVCPLLLDPTRYVCDSIDLTDEKAKEHWLSCFLDDKLKSFRDQARNTKSQDSDERAAKFYSSTERQMKELRSNGDPFSIRILLDLIQTQFKSHGFTDPFKDKKNAENQRALQDFRARLDDIDRVTDVDAKWTELIMGVLAGNIFDWGARAVSDILEEDDNFGLQSAMLQIEEKPWIYDGRSEFLKRIKDRPYKCAAVFVDNSGCDIILGIMPFVRQLVMLQTKVILCANSEPALNDVTWLELSKELIQSCCEQCDLLAAAYARQELVIYENGQTGPCLDLRNLHPALCEAMRTMEVDLVVLEGMGRAIHTNLNAEFKCDALKLACVKNEWLAENLGGKLFSLVCKFEPGQEESVEV